MSPEQARGDRTDARADVWAFGCVLYEMLTGARAFGHDTLAETLAAILEREPDWDRVPANVPAGIRRMLRRCLDKDPHRRLHAIADARIEIEDAGSDAEATDSASKHFPDRRRRALQISAAALVTLLAAAAAVWSLRPHAPKLQLVAAEITTPRTFDPWSFALAPDGRRIAFVADHEGYSMLWVRDLGSSSARVLTGTEGARRPFWSPDSRSIGYFANSELKRIDAAGGSARTIAYALGGTTAGVGTGRNYSLLRCRRARAAQGQCRRRQRDIRDGTCRGFDRTSPSSLPAGRPSVPVLSRAVRTPCAVSTWVRSTRPTRHACWRPIHRAPMCLLGWLLFVRDGVLLAQSFDLARRTLSGEPITVADSVAVEPITGSGAFSTSDAGVLTYRAAHPLVTRLSWFDRAGNSLGTFGAAEQLGLSNLRLSPDGRRVIAERTLQGETDLWMLDSTRQTRFTLGADGNIARLPTWSPNGDRIAFESVGSGTVKLAVKSASGGGGEEMLFESPQGKIPCDWSPDGRYLLYYVPDPRRAPICGCFRRKRESPSCFSRPMPTSSGASSPPTDAGWPINRTKPADTKSTCAPFQYKVARFQSRRRWRLSKMVSQWEGALLHRTGRQVMAAPMSTSATMAEAGAPVALFQTQRLGGGMNVIARGHQYDVTADGRFLVNVDSESSATPITLLLNWKPVRVAESDVATIH